MELQIYQWLIPLISLGFIVRSIYQHIRGTRSLRSVIIWVVLAIVIGGLAAIPDLISFPIAKFLGFKSNINAVIFIGLGVLFVINYYLNLRVIRLEKNLAELTREIAKQNAEVPDSE